MNNCSAASVFGKQVSVRSYGCLREEIMLDNWYIAMELSRLKSESVQREMQNRIWYKMLKGENKHLSSQKNFLWGNLIHSHSDGENRHLKKVS